MQYSITNLKKMARVLKWLCHRLMKQFLNDQVIFFAGVMHEKSGFLVTSFIMENNLE